jgi:hypothetical protein
MLDYGLWVVRPEVLERRIDRKIRRLIKKHDKESLRAGERELNVSNLTQRYNQRLVTQKTVSHDIGYDNVMQRFERLEVVGMEQWGTKVLQESQ